MFRKYVRLSFLSRYPVLLKDIAFRLKLGNSGMCEEEVIGMQMNQDREGVRFTTLSWKGSSEANADNIIANFIFRDADQIGDSQRCISSEHRTLFSGRDPLTGAEWSSMNGLLLIPMGFQKKISWMYSGCAVCLPGKPGSGQSPARSA
jgi:hypothetical protein